MIVLVGMVIGLVLGLTGAGGSIFAMPLLTLLLGLSVHDAVGLALGAVAVSSLVGALRCWHGGGILWLPATILGAAGAVSAPIGNMLGSKTSPSILAAGFTVLAFVVAIRMWQQAKAAPEQSHILRASPIASHGFIAPTCRLSQTGQFELKPRCVSALLFGGVVVGLVGGFFGVGGGFLVVPLILYLSRVSMQQAVSTSLAIVAVVSAGGFSTYLINVATVEWATLGWLVFGGVMGMMLGISSAQKLAGPTLQQVFSLLLALLAGLMLVKTLV